MNGPAASHSVLNGRFDVAIELRKRFRVLSMRSYLAP